MRITCINKTRSLAFLAITAVLFASAGCTVRQPHSGAEALSRQSDEYYRRAVAVYRRLIAASNAPDALYLRLGQLYLHHGEFPEAVEAFSHSREQEAKKSLAITYYRMGAMTDALEIFNRVSIEDDEYRYYHGMTAEKLNLYDEALKFYRTIEGREFKGKAGERIEVIEKGVSGRHIATVDPTVNARIIQSPPDDAYPQAGALILSCKEDIEISPAGTSDATLHYLIKILNERGKESFSETDIPYDSTYEKVELLFARTIKPDGTVADVGIRHLRDVSRYLNFPLYSNARAFIVSFPEVQIGSVIEYKVKIHDNHLIDKKHAIFTYTLKSREPILAADFKVAVPKDKRLNLKIINQAYNGSAARLEPIVEESGSKTSYRWSFRDIPQIIPEPGMPPDVEINPAILMSTFSDWREIYTWWWGLAQNKIKADDSIRAAVKELIAQTPSEEARVKAIYNFCAQKIRYVAVEYGQAGYEPHKAEDIFRNKYGDCKDKAVLLVTMLREAGIKAYPVLIATRDYYNLREDFPAIFFNHCIAAVATREGLVFLDPTAETCPFGDLPADDQKRMVLVIKDDSWQIQETPLYPAGHNYTRQVLSITLHDDESIAADRRVYTYGLYDQGQRHWLRYTIPELIKETLKEKAQQVSIGALLDSYAIDNLQDLNTPVVLRYMFHGPEYVSTAGKLKILPQIASVDASLVAKDTRVYPLDFGVLGSKETDYVISLPRALKINYMPASITEESRWLKVDVAYRVRENSIHMTQKIVLKSTVVTPQEYPDYKKFIERLAKNLKESIVLERKK